MLAPEGAMSPDPEGEGPVALGGLLSVPTVPPRRCGSVRRRTRA